MNTYRLQINPKDWERVLTKHKTTIDLLNDEDPEALPIVAAIFTEALKDTPIRVKGADRDYDDPVYILVSCTENALRKFAKENLPETLKCYWDMNDFIEQSQEGVKPLRV